MKTLCGYWDLGAKGVAADYGGSTAVALGFRIAVGSPGLHLDVRTITGMGPVGADGASGPGSFTSSGGQETFDVRGRDPPAS